MERITIRDVASKAGVSISTASKALNKTGKISSDTIQKVIDAANELHYTVNIAGQALSKRNNKIGIIMPKNPVEVMHCFEAGFRNAMQDYGKFGIDFEYQTYDMFHDETEFLNSLHKLQKTVNGLIIIVGKNNQSYVGEIQKVAEHIPVIPLLSMIDGFEGIASVMVNAGVVGKMAAEYLHLVSRSRKWAVIAGNQSVYIHKENIRSFCEMAAAFGSEVVFKADTDNRMDIAYQQTERILKEQPDVDGIFVTSYVAPGVCNCLADHQKQGKIAVIGVDLYKETAENLNTGCLNAIIFQNQVLQAYTAVRMMTEYLNQRHAVSSEVIKPELVLKSNLECYEWQYIYDEKS